MPTFTLTPQYDNDPPTTLEIDVPDDEAAIKQARAHLQVTVEEKPTVRSGRIGVGRGGQADQVQWLGAWSWTDDDCWTWSPKT
jgi:hypothetical protein